MHTVDQYIDAACQRKGFTDRQLGKYLGKSHATVCHWRTKRSWPSDDTMIALAEVAGMDIDQALLDLNTWRATGPARAAYERIASRLAVAAFAIFFVMGHGKTAPAQSLTAGNVPFGAISVYIMENTINILR